jgi:hypothetical protein
MSSLTEATLAEGDFTARERALLQALQPFAYYGSLDGTVHHFAALFPVHERERIKEEFARATRVYRKATSAKEES